MRNVFLIGLLALHATAGASLASREAVVSGPPAQDGGLSAGEFAFTFDDGPDPEVTPQVLAALRRHQVKAVFFQVGDHVAPHPELTQAVLHDGHSLGSHSWDHADLTTLTLNDALANIQRGHQAVEQAGSTRTPFFRFPFFSWNDSLMNAVRARGLLPFHANVVPGDWDIPDPQELLARTLEALEREGHGIVLLHDVHRQTGEFLEDLLTAMETRSYRTVVFRAAQSIALRTQGATESAKHRGSALVRRKNTIL